MSVFHKLGKKKGAEGDGNGSGSGHARKPSHGPLGYVNSHVSIDPAASMAQATAHGKTANSALTTSGQDQMTSLEQGMASESMLDDAAAEIKHPIKHGRNISKASRNIGGLPVNIFGMAELSPATARALAPPPPEVCIAIHMHGRGGSADNEEHIVRHLWDRVARSRARHGHNGQRPMRELLFISFDGRNHGHRKTSTLGQKGWKQGNALHGMDLYSMIVGSAQDVSFLIDFLPSYLFPHDERRVTQWVVTGKSLGGHATWHVLANDARVTVGVPFISCPSYAKLMERRTKTAFVANGPPHVPHSLAHLIARIDPASQPFDVPDPQRNPFWGKRICMLNGGADKLVPFRCAEDFIHRLKVGPPDGPNGEQLNLRVSVRDDLGHEVTEEMLEDGGRWIFQHAVVI